MAKGQTLTEYGFVIALVSLTAMAGLGVLSGSISNGFDNLVQVKDGSAQASMPTSGGGSSLVNMSVTPVANLNSGVASTPNVALAQSLSSGSAPTQPQVSGSNGTSATVYANSDQILAEAAAFEQSDPALFNLLIQLGQQGKVMAGKINTSQMGINQPLDTEKNTYEQLWQQVQFSPTYKTLNRSVQQRLSQLAMQSASIAQSYVVVLGQTTQAAGQAAATVVNNSTAIIDCGTSTSNCATTTSSSSSNSGNNQGNNANNSQGKSTTQSASTNNSQNGNANSKASNGSSSKINQSGASGFSLSITAG